MAIDWDACVLAPVMTVFGEDAGVLYTPVTGPAFTLMDAVYDSNYSRAEVDRDGNQVVSEYPVLGVRTALVTPAQGDRLKILSTGETFAVAEVIPDGHGHALLRLDSADPL